MTKEQYQSIRACLEEVGRARKDMDNAISASLARIDKAIATVITGLREIRNPGDDANKAEGEAI